MTIPENIQKVLYSIPERWMRKLVKHLKFILKRKLGICSYKIARVHFANEEKMRLLAGGLLKERFIVVKTFTPQLESSVAAEERQVRDRSSSKRRLSGISWFLGKGQLNAKFVRSQLNRLFDVIHLGAKNLRYSLPSKRPRCAAVVITVDQCAGIVNKIRNWLHKCIEVQGDNFEYM